MNRTELKFLLIISLLLTLSFPPFPFGILAPFAVAMFLWLLDGKKPSDGFRLGYWQGLLWGAFTLFWIAASTIPGAILAIGINAFHYAAIGWLYLWLRKKSKLLSLVGIPFLWVAAEYLRLFTELRFNWLTLAHSQTYYLPLIQFIEYTGYLGLSFLTMVIAVCIYAVLTSVSRKRWIPGISILIVIIGISVWGSWRMQKIEGESYPLIKVGLVQPNVDPYEKWKPEFQREAFHMLMDASRSISQEHPQLIIWPETAVPFYLRARLSALQDIHAFVDSAKVFLLTGTPDYEYFADEEDYHTYNAAFFFQPGKNSFLSHYKTTLVPGSETVPFKEKFPVLRKIEVGGGDFFRGHQFTVFKFSTELPHGIFRGQKSLDEQKSRLETVNLGISPIICYESVFPNFVRKFVASGANLLSIITNDGWFGTTSGPYQHARFAVLRAVENRVSIIRCANTGISGFIAPTGVFYQKAGLNTRKNLIARVAVNQKKSFYTQKGEWFGNFILGVSFLIILCKFGFQWMQKRYHGATSK